MGSFTIVKQKKKNTFWFKIIVKFLQEGKNYEVKSTELHKDEDKLVITMKEQIPKGKAIVKVNKNGSAL